MPRGTTVIPVSFYGDVTIKVTDTFVDVIVPPRGSRSEFILCLDPPETQALRKALKRALRELDV